jgi:hypothetical protein
MSQEAACSEHRTIDDAALRAALWGVYTASFGDAGEQCIQEQLCYTPETFDAAMRDPAYLKFVVSDAGEPVGLLVCTNDLEKARVAYVNPRRLLRDYPEYAGRIYYYTIIAVRPDRQGMRYAGMLVEGVAVVMDREGALSAFDFSTEKNPHLPDLIVRATEAAQRRRGLSTTSAKFTPLGGQQYGVIKLS